jgi:hypothetical protein
MSQLAARRAHEIELYQQLGFPDFFTRDDLCEFPMQVQCLSYRRRECEVMLKGSRVLGHPHAVTQDEVNEVEWDGVARPRTFREYRSHVQSISPLISPKSPLGRALQDFRPTDWRTQSPQWDRLVDWWALSRVTRDRHLEPLLRRALQQMGTMHDGYGLVALRLAAELVSPGFAKLTLVSAGHWPPSSLGVSRERLRAAFPVGYPDRYSVYCRATGDHLGPLYHLHPWDDSDLREEELFAEEDRRTSVLLSTTGYVITGDGEVWRREKMAWRRFGPAKEALLVRPPKAERRRLG